MIQQVVFDTAELIFRKGVKHVVLSPGSRNAPLTISFARHPHLKIYSIVDERSAGFIALGMAQRVKEPVVICCTSGSALLNYLPAIAEAYYQHIPLLVMTADRPPEWIDQRDGQTINQSGVTNNFIKGFFQMPVDLNHPDAQWEYNRKLNEALNMCRRPARGPVHINIPFREPFYPEKSQKLSYSEKFRVIEDDDYPERQISIPDKLLDIWKKSEKKLLIVGQHDPSEDLTQMLLQFAKKHQVIILTDVISNQNHESFIRYHDHYLGKLNNVQSESLKPDLIISIGKSVVSKPLKIFLRKNKPAHHWHFEESDIVSDTFQSLTWKSDIPAEIFIGTMISTDLNATTTNNKFAESWYAFEAQAIENIKGLTDMPFSEYTASHLIGQSIPENHILHLANSMPVRFANLLRNIRPEVEVYCNRGTSGIDGSNSTAVGDVIVSGKKILLWTGDLAFFYDRNAFFHQHEISNLRIIVMNNQGGGIFRLINGPRALPELEPFFETRHQHKAESIANEFGFEYLVAHDMETLKPGIEKLFSQSGGKKILEIFTEPSVNEEVYKLIKNKSYE